MIEPASQKKQPKTAVQRQQKYRDSLEGKGQERVTLVIERESVQLMRQISHDHNATISDVVKAGAQLVARELKVMAKNAAERAE